jgi:sulfhydrogenase subunit beta (sulfur reductase)
MMTLKKIKVSDLSKWIDSMNSKDRDIVGPVKKHDKLLWGKINNFKDISLDHVQTELSAKSYVFPRCEELFTYKNTPDGLDIEDTKTEVKETVIMGLRPCDAAAFKYTDTFFNEPNKDFHYNRRREKTIIVSFSCKSADEFCFCTSVGLNPGSTEGADVLLTFIDNNEAYVEVLTEKGQGLIDECKEVFTDTSEVDKAPYLAKVEQKINGTQITEKLKAAFDSPKWVMQSMACLGCGACAFACPTCTCFDIQDEGDAKGGARLRCWDSCGFGLFTKHASGHNPRHNQVERRRQRLMHKFAYSVENLNTLSCVGCGRCIRVCPSQLNIVENLNAILED